jgi:DNA-binding response OmpR family regulator
MRVLLIEDDATLCGALNTGLGRAGFAVDTLGAAEPGDAALRCTTYDLLILDVGLPGMSGLALLRTLRQRGDTVPVLMLTARDTLEERVQGLNQGADDYLVKPFLMPELVARCQALVRRSRAAASSVLDFGGLTLDLGLRETRLHGRPLDLTRREWDLLQHLMLNAPNIASKQKLVDSLSAWNHEVTANAVEIYASRLRAKLIGSGVTLRTVRGLGYRLELDPVDHEAP